MHLAGNEFMIITEKWTLSHAMMGEIILVFNIYDQIRDLSPQ